MSRTLERAHLLTYPVAGHDMQVKRGANRAVLRFCVPVFESIDTSCPRHRAVGLRNVGSNAGLIVMKLIIAIAVKHTIYLEDIGVRVCTAELVASAIEAEDELLANMSSALYGGGGLHSVVLRARDSARMRVLRLLFLVLLRHSQGWQEQRERKQIVAIDSKVRLTHAATALEPLWQGHRSQMELWPYMLIPHLH